MMSRELLLLPKEKYEMMLNSKEEPRTPDKEDKADEYLPETSGKTRKQRHQNTDFFFIVV